MLKRQIINFGLSKLFLGVRIKREGIFRSTLIGLMLILLFIVITSCQPKQPQSITITKSELRDKIKGAWAAQTIGCTFGAPIEFRYNGTMVQDYQKILWDKNSLKECYEKTPGLYDDVYMDLTFVQVIENNGIDAPADSFANAFANAGYKLWFANQTARNNILNGIKPPESGYWLNNPCADDIDFQIEADFAGIMCPGMVNSASGICNKVGHIMNYGDGWYGGVYVAALYSQAFISDNIEYIVKEALKVIPPESKFARTISDVIKWHKENPDDWKATWFKVHRKWSEDIGSAHGVFEPFNIDAKINAAWVTIGLLYGNGDFTKTYEIATRCGDDADCNPSTAGGILGAIKGYSKIPDFWKQGLNEVEDIDFKYTTISLKDAYKLSYEHALKMIKRNDGIVNEKEVEIKIQQVKSVPLEVAFKEHYPYKKINLETKLKSKKTFNFNGKGFVVTGNAKKLGSQDYIFNVEMYIDGKLIETIKVPTNFTKRRFYLFWQYQMPMKEHEVMLKVLNLSDKAEINLDNVLIYRDKPNKVRYLE